LNQSASSGTTVTLSDNNALLTIPASVAVPAGASSANFTATVGTITTTQSATITATLNRASQSTTLSLAAPMLVSALGCNSSSVNSGASTTCTVTLNQSAPTGGTVVALSDNNASLTVPALLTIAASATSATFTATVGTIITTQSATITATLNRASQSTTLSLAAPMLVSNREPTDHRNARAGNTVRCVEKFLRPMATGIDMQREKNMLCCLLEIHITPNHDDQEVGASQGQCS